jgi:hypothetical protein
LEENASTNGRDEATLAYPSALAPRSKANHIH